MASPNPLNRYFELTVEMTDAGEGTVRDRAPLAGLDIAGPREQVRDDLPAPML